jgi:hypothetical protein
MRIGADRVKEVSAQKLLQEFENIEFKEGEGIEDFGMRITNLVTTLKSLGETIEETRVVKKFLGVVPTGFAAHLAVFYGYSQAIQHSTPAISEARIEPCTSSTSGSPFIHSFLPPPAPPSFILLLKMDMSLHNIRGARAPGARSNTGSTNNNSTNITKLITTSSLLSNSNTATVHV